MMSCLLSFNPQINREDKQGNTPLHMAAISGNLTASSMIIKHGQHNSYLNNGNFGCNLIIDSLTCQRQTPQMKAAENGNYEICKLLIENGADVHFEDLFG
jgi:ankyrin repeat protein